MGYAHKRQMKKGELHTPDCLSTLILDWQMTQERKRDPVAVNIVLELCLTPYKCRYTG